MASRPRTRGSKKFEARPAAHGFVAAAKPRLYSPDGRTNLVSPESLRMTAHQRGRRLPEGASLDRLTKAGNAAVAVKRDRDPHPASASWRATLGRTIQFFEPGEVGNRSR